MHYKKSELMILRRATSYSSSYQQVVLISLYPFRHNSLLECAPQPKIAKKSLKLSILRVQGRTKSSMMILLKSSSPTASLCLSATVFTLD